MKKVLIFVGAVLLLSVPASLLQLRKPAEAHFGQSHGPHYSPENEWKVHFMDDLENDLTTAQKDAFNEIWGGIALHRYWLLSLEDPDGSPGAPSYDTIYGDNTDGKEAYAQDDHPPLCPDPCTVATSAFTNWEYYFNDPVNEGGLGGCPGVCDIPAIYCDDTHQGLADACLELNDYLDAVCTVASLMCPEWSGFNLQQCYSCAADLYDVCGQGCLYPGPPDPPDDGWPWHWTEDQYRIFDFLNSQLDSSDEFDWWNEFILSSWGHPPWLQRYDFFSGQIIDNDDDIYETIPDYHLPVWDYKITSPLTEIP